MNHRTSLPDRLRELPDFDPPPGGWSRLVNQLERPPPRRRRVGLAPLALAASLLLAVGVVSLLPTTPAPAPLPSDVARLMQQSQALEGELDRVKPQVVVWDGTLAATTASLRNDLAVVDLQLSYAGESNPAGVERLWQNRVALMSQLVRTHQEATLDAPAARIQEQYL